MKLRNWQADCVEIAIKKYEQGKSHFLVLATPGAGKTVMASSIAKQLIEQDIIDIVVCFSPSSSVCVDFCDTLESIIGESFDGLIGSKGTSLTYQSMSHLDARFWQLFELHKVFVIFDEIHHCAGSCVENSNTWGEQIILNIQSKAKLTLALTGTPWRSDSIPIVLSKYHVDSNKIQCDYVYGLSDAIKDNVCRMPNTIVIDNDNISVTEKNRTKLFTSFKDLLSNSVLSYQEVIENEKVIQQIVHQANTKLDILRKINSNAGGLIVASSVEHANKIFEIMHCKLNEVATVITYREKNPTALIHQFRESSSKWVISVGMISEGTNIPRLQVCCHLSNIKTELHYRQVLGRILRQTDSTNNQAYFYIPAEPKLVEYAYRVSMDIPTDLDLISFHKIGEYFEYEECDTGLSFPNCKPYSAQSIEDKFVLSALRNVNDENISRLTENYDKMINVIGQFRQETIELEL